MISHFSHLKDIIRSTFSLSLWQTTIQLVSLFKFHCLKYIFMTKNNFLTHFSFMHNVLHPWKPTASLECAHWQSARMCKTGRGFLTMNVLEFCTCLWIACHSEWFCFLSELVAYHFFLFPIKVFWIVLHVCGVIKTCFLFRIKVYIKISWINLNCFQIMEWYNIFMYIWYLKNYIFPKGQMFKTWMFLFVLDYVNPCWKNK